MKRRSIVLSLLLLLILLFPTGFLYAQEKKSLAIMPLSSNAGVSKADSNLLTQYLETNLVNTKAFTIIASDQRDKILGEQQFSLSGCTDQSCVVQIGQLLSAQYMVFGTVNKQQNQYIISVKRVNVETSQIEESAIETMLTLSTPQIEATTRNLAFKLAGMKPPEAAAPEESYTGTLVVLVSPKGATGMFNLSEKIPSFPFTKKEVPVGEYPLRIEKEGYKTEILSVKVEKGKTTEVDRTLQQAIGPPKKPPKGKGFLTVYSSPPGMSIVLDNELLEQKTPLENYPLEAGEHIIAVGDYDSETFYYIDTKTYVTIRDGETTELPVELERTRGNIKITCNIDGAFVYVNGKHEGTIKNGSIFIQGIPSGPVEVKVARNKYTPVIKEAEVRSNGVEEISVNLVPEPVKVIFDSNPQAAEVLFNGRSIGKTPTFQEDVKQGTYWYALSFNGYTTPRNSITISGTDDRTIIEELNAPVEVDLNDPKDGDAEIYLDGKYAGDTKDRKAVLSSVSFGEHVLEVKKKGYRDEKRNIVVKSEDDRGKNRFSFDLSLYDIKYTILSEPSGAAVVVDGKKADGATPMTIRLAEGSHEIRVMKKGYLEQKSRVVVDSPKGGMLRLSLLEGEDPAVLLAYYKEQVKKIEDGITPRTDGKEIGRSMDGLLGELSSYTIDTSRIRSFLQDTFQNLLDNYYKGRVEKLEIPNAGVLQCEKTIERINSLRSELSSFSINTTSLKNYLFNRSNYYKNRKEQITGAIDALQKRISVLKAEEQAHRKKAGGLAGWEIASVVTTLGSGTGAFFSGREAWQAYNTYKSATITTDAVAARERTTLFSILMSAAIAVSAGTVVADIILPGHIGKASKAAKEASGELKAVSAALAKLSASTTAELAVSDEELAGGLKYRIYKVGDTGPAGGIVFYDKGSYSNGWRWLEAAPASTEWSNIKWGASGTDISGAKGTAIGTGKQNTADIVAYLGTGSTYAAQLCHRLNYGGYNDWFLPSKEELNLMYKNLYKHGVGGFSGSYYWSSSESDAYSAWRQTFGNGSQASSSKVNSTRVRAVRAF